MFTYLFEKNNFKCVFIAKVIISYCSKENALLKVPYYEIILFLASSETAEFRNVVGQS